MAGSPPGHLAVLRERAAAGPLSLTLFDGTMSADWNWSQRDEAMDGCILAAPLAAMGTLVVAGNAHTRTARTRLGVPLGARLAGQRPGLREIRIRYGGGHFYNIQPRRFRRRPRSPAAGAVARATWQPRPGLARGRGSGRAAAAHAMAGGAAPRIAAIRLLPPHELHRATGTAHDE
jgi:hypothetical protein